MKYTFLGAGVCAMCLQEWMVASGCLLVSCLIFNYYLNRILK